MVIQIRMLEKNQVQKTMILLVMVEEIRTQIIVRTTIRCLAEKLQMKMYNLEQFSRKEEYEHEKEL